MILEQGFQLANRKILGAGPVIFERRVKRPLLVVIVQAADNRTATRSQRRGESAGERQS